MREQVLRNEKVLVTGGAGFIGSNLCESLLENNNKVVCLDNFATGKNENIEEFRNNSNYTLIEGDIRNFEDCKKAVSGVSIVFHHAALGSVPRSINDPITSTDVNINGFVKMLFASKEAGVKRFIYAASSSTYGDHQELPKIEDRIGKPLSPYAITKYVNELYARNFTEIYDIETIGLRYFNVFGKKQDPKGTYAAVIPKFINQLIHGIPPIINGDGKHSRDFTYIKNVINANQLAAITSTRESINKVYNIACGQSVTLLDLIEILKSILLVYIPKMKNVNPIFGPERVGDVKDSLASIEKASNFLGYTPRYDIRSGLKETVVWYLENEKRNLLVI